MRRVAIILACAAVTIAVVPPAGATSAGVMAQAVKAPPAAGTCWNLSDSQAEALTLPGAAQVMCTQPHTVEVVGIAPVPANLAKRWAPARAVLYASRACQTMVNSYTGIASADEIYASPITFAGYAQSQPSWFLPPRTAWRSGPWIACAALSLTPDDGGSRTAPVVGSVAGSAAQLRLVSRAFATGTYRLISSLPISNKAAARYPSTKRLRERAAAACTASLGSAPAWVTWPSRAAWRAGIRQVGCWIP